MHINIGYHANVGSKTHFTIELSKVKYFDSIQIYTTKEIFQCFSTFNIHMFCSGDLL